MKRILRAAAACAAVLAAGRALEASVHTLDAPASPVRIGFDDEDGRLTAVVKAKGTTWIQGPAARPYRLKVTAVTQSSPSRLAAQAVTATGSPLQLRLALDPATGDLAITIGGDPGTTIGEGIRYPLAFFPPDGSGFAVLPLLSGYLVPTSQIDWKAPWPHTRMEWFGGTDAQTQAGWMYVAQNPADLELLAPTAEIDGQARLGGSFLWLGSNANSGLKPNRLSYDRTAVLHFFTAGGYVAQAKRFRQFAVGQGWIKSLAQKQAQIPEIGRLIGAPVIYLWGDGRSSKMLAALKQAGIDQALIQLSINHVDPAGAFPNEEFHDGAGWAKAVRAFGYVPGIYDIYDAVRPNRRAGPIHDGRRYEGFTYLWPPAAQHWNYLDSDGSPGLRPSISADLSSQFALLIRLPAQIRQFGFDAFFLDTVCAVEPHEDYDAADGHVATRTADIRHRVALLQAPGRLGRIVGTEQLKSWAVPVVDWAEGQFKLGASNAPGQYGRWNNEVYPQVPLDEVDPGDKLALILNPGFQVPLWDLVYHEDAISVQHWHLAHDKLLYCWDFADQMALLRGQSPLLNLVYAGSPGEHGRAIASATDAETGKRWDTRWTNPNVADHVRQTYRRVCQWEGQVAEMEMIDHRILAPDFSVQLSEFSEDGGRTGRGVVVNLGHFDGHHRMTGPTWSGEIRGQSLTAPVNGSAEYRW